jgi:hypothetical protein
MARASALPFSMFDEGIANSISNPHGNGPGQAALGLHDCCFLWSV